VVRLALWRAGGQDRCSNILNRFLKFANFRWLKVIVSVGLASFDVMCSVYSVLLSASSLVGVFCAG
jgi:hypothetical protein